ncbi:MAG: GGDEF domain-containing protein, partial [Clostridia bacterium]|nr:GGDEF domain-containing protein [Clostridia bacterium]
TVGILYGIIDPVAFKERYSKSVSELKAQLYVYVEGTGNFVLDTYNETLGNISELKDRKYKKGFSYEDMINTERGYSSFQSKSTGEVMYAHYAPLGISDWKILLVRPELIVFKNARIISSALFGVFSLMILIFGLYLFLIFSDEKRRSSIALYASKIRKLLLDINTQKSNIYETMESITLFTKARSTIFVDTDGDDFNYICTNFAEKLLIDEDRKYFVSELFRYAADMHGSRGTTFTVIELSANMGLQKSNPKFYDFISVHDIEEICFAAVSDKHNRTNILGIINPKRSKTAMALLEEIAVCFSIAIYNKNYLNRTELAAATDSLTGLLNRVSAKKDMVRFDEEKAKNFACVYVDVNELHLCNNKYGHAAGDEMLLYIANTLREVYYGHNIYRMGGDEFLVFMCDVNSEEVKQSSKKLMQRLEPKNYHVAVGTSYRIQNTNCDELMREAEIRMYEAKAHYYQNKEQKSVSLSEDQGYKCIKTGISEIDTLLSVMKEHYSGIYRVKLSDDIAKRIIMPSYLGYKEEEHGFSRLLSKYITEAISPDFHRALLSFMNYDAIRGQLMNGNIPRVTYKRTNGETMILSVYSLSHNSENVDDTLWVFEKA